MPPTPASQAASQVTSMLTTFVVLLVLSSFVGFLVAQKSGAKSRSTRQAIFTVVSLGLCGFTYYIFLRVR